MCTERYIHPFTDFGFKRLFGNEHHKEFRLNCKMVGWEVR